MNPLWGLAGSQERLVAKALGKLGPEVVCSSGVIGYVRPKGLARVIAELHPSPTSPRWGVSRGQTNEETASATVGQEPGPDRGKEIEDDRFTVRCCSVRSNGADAAFGENNGLVARTIAVVVQMADDRAEVHRQRVNGAAGVSSEAGRGPWV